MLGEKESTKRSEVYTRSDVLLCGRHCAYLKRRDGGHTFFQLQGPVHPLQGNGTLEKGISKLSDL